MANHQQRAAALLVAGLFVVIIMASPAQAQSFNVLFNFSGSNGQNPLYINVGAAGNFYGTTYYGGTNGGYGAVFKLSRSGSGWFMTPLYNFSGQEDGAYPWSGVVTGRDGSLYGTTKAGGRNGAGVVYKLQPPLTACKTVICYWTQTVLYNFTGYFDGSGPQGNLVFDQAGNLYGTTVYGGAAGFGTLWELTPSQGLMLVHTFTGRSDGAEPVGGVILDQAGNLYGVTAVGGTSNFGVVYEFSPGASGWTETVLHTFSGAGDGAYPNGLISDSEGNLYGFTTDGGGPDWGTAYELQPDAGGFSYSMIYVFQPQSGGRPGLGNLPTLHDGNLYGGASSGGTNNDGAIFELTPAAGSWYFTSLHDFAGPDGNEPAASPVFDAAGNLYGVTYSGGTSNFGVIWQIIP